MTNSHWFRKSAPTLLLALYFLYLVWPATGDYLNPDDSMNLYHAWITPVRVLLRDIFEFWRGAVRPVGDLYYRLVYALTGFDPFPFRATCFVLLIINLVLTYRFYRLVTASTRDSFVAAFFGCFHGAMWNIYASTGTIYDILCQTFILTAMVLYVRGRSSGAVSWRRASLIWLIDILAIGSKEMAYTLPLVFVAFELTFYPPRTWSSLPLWARRQLKVVGIAGLISVTAWIGRRASNYPVDQLYGYRTFLTTENIVHSLRQYLFLLSFKTVAFGSASALTFVAAALVAAILLRSRLMLFGWLYALVFAIPLLIVPSRYSGYVLYIPFTGCALYLAGGFRWICSRLQWANNQISQSPFSRALPSRVIFFAFLLTTILLHLQERGLVVARDFVPGGEKLVQVLSEDVSRLYPKLPSGTRILLVNDAFGNEPWQAIFVIQLTYGDRSLKISKLRWATTSGALTIPSGVYDHVFVYDGTHYREVRTD